jgi:hypothetical protein
LENLKGIDHFGDLIVDERLILKLVLNKEDLTVWIGFIWIKIASSNGISCEDPSGSIKCMEFLD